MTAYTGLLRAIREEVVPQIPTLASQLREDNQAIYRAVREILARTGVSPVSIGEADLNKVVRHSISGFLIGQQRQVLIEGSGHDAHFRSMSRCLLTRLIGPNPYTFKRDLRKTMDAGATQVERMFTDGKDPEHTWYPFTSFLYTGLGRRAVQLAKEHMEDRCEPGRRRHIRRPKSVPNGGIPAEGVFLGYALRTEGLHSAVSHHASFVRRRVKRGKQRLKAAHDLAYLPKIWTAQHVLEFRSARPLYELDTTVVQDEEQGGYRLAEGRPSNWRKVFQRQDVTPNSTLQCAARAGRDEVTGDTNVDYFMHAAINAAREYRLF